MTSPPSPVESPFGAVAITGAAGGIGSALARELAGPGARLALADLDEALLTGLAEELRQGGASVITCGMDVRDAAAWERFAAEVEAEHGGCGMLINNAGVTVFGAFSEMSVDRIDLVLDVNLRGVVYGCRAFLPLLRATGDGRIVNISSLAGLVGIPSQSTYCASKFGVRGFSAALRAELAPEGIGVTTVLPGAVATDFLRRAQTSRPEMTGRLADLMVRYGVQPHLLARRILRAVRRNRAELVVAPEARISAWLVRLAPGLLRWGLETAAHRIPLRRPPRDEGQAD